MKKCEIKPGMVVNYYPVPDISPVQLTVLSYPRLVKDEYVVQLEGRKGFVSISKIKRYAPNAQ